jgi:hypothetical protein
MAMAKDERNAARSNQLLGALASASLGRIDPHLEPIRLKLGDIVCEAGGLLKHAYFPEGAVLSLLTVLENGSAIETANIGREGAFGLFAAMYSRVSFNRCLVQLVGGMVRCPIELLQSEFKRSEHVRDLFVSYSETLLSQVQQTVACNAMHTTEEKMCRWLLMMHDRAEGEVLTYTHEFLVAHAGGQSQIGDAGSAINAGGRPYKLSSREDSDSGSSRPRKSILRVLRRCQGAVQRVFDAATNCVSGQYKRPKELTREMSHPRSLRIR